MADRRRSYLAFSRIPRVMVAGRLVAADHDPDFGVDLAAGASKRPRLTWTRFLDATARVGCFLGAAVLQRSRVPLHIGYSAQRARPLCRLARTSIGVLGVHWLTGGSGIVLARPRARANSVRHFLCGVGSSATRTANMPTDLVRCRRIAVLARANASEL